MAVWDMDRLKKRVAEFDEIRPGPVQDGDWMSAESLARFEPLFPRIMDLFWRKNCLGHMLNQSFWLCDPALFAPVMSVLFEGDPDIDPKRTHVYGYTAFGRLVAWNEVHRNIQIDLLYGNVKAYHLLDPTRLDNADLAAIAALQYFRTMDSHDVEGDDDKWLFRRAKKKLGAPDYGECYRFFPALPLGGPVDLDHIKRVKAVEHFSLLAQLQDFKLMDYVIRPIRAVRWIGPQE